MQSVKSRQDEKIKAAGGVKVHPPGCRPCWQLGDRLIWTACGNGIQVMVGYAANPTQSGVLMYISTALKGASFQ